jgi:hypothetical protein
MGIETKETTGLHTVPEYLRKLADIRELEGGGARLDLFHPKLAEESSAYIWKLLSAVEIYHPMDIGKYITGEAVATTEEEEELINCFIYSPISVFLRYAASLYEGIEGIKNQVDKKSWPK